MKTVSPDFTPALWHPFYFIRKGLVQHIKKNAPFLKGKLMDFGCGSKPYRSFFSVDEYIGVDFYNEGHPHDNEQIDVFYDGKKLPFEAGYFDSILCSEVFEHIFNLDEVLSELNRVLKLDGQMLITCPFVWNEHEVPFDYARYTQYALRDMLQKKGFEIVEFAKAGNFVTALSQLWVLYFMINLEDRCRKFALLRWTYKSIFVFLPNLAGLLTDKLLPDNKSLYLNNVVLVKKVRPAI